MGKEKKYFFALADFVDGVKGNYTEDVVQSFHEYLKSDYTDKEFCKLLSCAGFIPDLYPSDSSEETLFSKFVEILVAEWAERMNFESRIVKTKGGYEDIDITIENAVIVCDAKSFRLGRSQQAPNVKDFLKPADIKKWLSRYKNGLGGLVTYPDTHDWGKSSDVYLYCTDKNCPAIVLSYIHLALLLHFRRKKSTKKLKKLWDYEKLFPDPLKKNVDGGNRLAYWKAVNGEICSILKISESDFCAYFEKCKNLQFKCIRKNIEKLQEIKTQTIKNIKNECEKLSEEELRKEFVKYKIKAETSRIDEFIDRIRKFRLNEIESDG